MASEIENLIKALAKLPTIGPRSAKSIALKMLTKKQDLMHPLVIAMEQAIKNTTICSICNNLDAINPCHICQDNRRDQSTICVVEKISDLWALEGTKSYKGLYHVLGGVLSALDGITPDDLDIPNLVTRSQNPNVKEVIIALNTSIDGQATMYYLTDYLELSNVEITVPSRGVPMGGELDHLDDGTLITALNSRKQIEN